jgi:hypothetical protein
LINVDQTHVLYLLFLNSADLNKIIYKVINFYKNKGSGYVKKALGADARANKPNKYDEIYEAC